MVAKIPCLWMNDYSIQCFSIIDYDECKFNLISVIGLEDNSLVMFPI